MLIICIVVGGYISALFKDTFLQLPTFVWCLFVGIIIRNTLTHVFKHEVFEPTVDVLVALLYRFSWQMALMSIKFGQLASMAGPVLIIIAVQTVAMVLFACFVTLKMMGKRYDAVVISAGHCGLVWSNTNSNCEYANSHKAFDHHIKLSLSFLWSVPLLLIFQTVS